MKKMKGLFHYRFGSVLGVAVRMILLWFVIVLTFVLLFSGLEGNFDVSSFSRIFFDVHIFSVILLMAILTAMVLAVWLDSGFDPSIYALPVSEKDIVIADFMFCGIIGFVGTILLLVTANITSEAVDTVNLLFEAVSLGTGWFVLWQVWILCDKAAYCSDSGIRKFILTVCSLAGFPVIYILLFVLMRWRIPMCLFFIIGSVVLQPILFQGAVALEKKRRLKA